MHDQPFKANKWDGVANQDGLVDLDTLLIEEAAAAVGEEASVSFAHRIYNLRARVSCQDGQWQYTIYPSEGEIGSTPVSSRPAGIQAALDDWFDVDGEWWDRALGNNLADPPGSGMKDHPPDA